MDRETQMALIFIIDAACLYLCTNLQTWLISELSLSLLFTGGLLVLFNQGYAHMCSKR